MDYISSWLGVLFKYKGRIVAQSISKTKEYSYEFATELDQIDEVCDFFE